MQASKHRLPKLEDSLGFFRETNGHHTNASRKEVMRWVATIHPASPARTTTQTIAIATPAKVIDGQWEDPAKAPTDAIAEVGATDQGRFHIRMLGSTATPPLSVTVTASWNSSTEATSMPTDSSKTTWVTAMPSSKMAS